MQKNVEQRPIFQTSLLIRANIKPELKMCVQIFSITPSLIIMDFALCFNLFIPNVCTVWIHLVRVSGHFRLSSVLLPFLSPACLVYLLFAYRPLWFPHLDSSYGRGKNVKAKQITEQVLPFSHNKKCRWHLHSTVSPQSGSCVRWTGSLWLVTSLWWNIQYRCM